MIRNLLATVGAAFVLAAGAAWFLVASLTRARWT